METAVPNPAVMVFQRKTVSRFRKKRWEGKMDIT
jgi:hypothetical protein